MSEHIINVSDDSFDSDVLHADTLTLVDFWAEWCGPCKMIAPILEELAPKYLGKIRFAKLNIDENNKTPVKYGIKGIPTLILFKNGDEADRKIGTLSKAQLVEFLDKNL
jgi:thioredoxin 1